MNEAWSIVKSASPLQEMFLASEDIEKCLGSLSKLRPHFAEPMIVTGGLAAGWHLLNNGVRRQKRSLNDIDLVVEDISHLNTSLGQDFLIRHFHPFREKGKILIMLVDEEHGTRIDVFTPGTSSLIDRLTSVIIGEIPLRLVSAEDLLAKLLSIVYAATESKPVEAKYVRYFDALLKVAELETVRAVWGEYRKENQLLDFAEAAAAVRRSIASNPLLLQASLYSQDINQACVWCQESEMFPLAPLPRIYDALGYV